MAVYNLDEQESGVYTGTMTDETGAALAKANLTALTMTLYEKETAIIINDREDQDVLDDHNVTVGDTDGVITWAIQPEDTVIIRPDCKQEDHVALIVATWGAGTKRKPHEVVLRVRNLMLQP